MLSFREWRAAFEWKYSRIASTLSSIYALASAFNPKFVAFDERFWLFFILGFEESYSESALDEVLPPSGFSSPFIGVFNDVTKKCDRVHSNIKLFQQYCVKYILNWSILAPVDWDPDAKLWCEGIFVYLNCEEKFDYVARVKIWRVMAGNKLSESVGGIGSI